MYAMIAVHNQTASTNIITTLSLSVLPTVEYELFYSDGINSFKRNTSSKIIGENIHTLVTKDKKKVKRSGFCYGNIYSQFIRRYK